MLRRDENMENYPARTVAVGSIVQQLSWIALACQECLRLLGFVVPGVDRFEAPGVARFQVLGVESLLRLKLPGVERLQVLGVELCTSPADSALAVPPNILVDVVLLFLLLD
eukprot:3898296-Amphidinium_carterae.1